MRALVQCCMRFRSSTIMHVDHGFKCRVPKVLLTRVLAGIVVPCFYLFIQIRTRTAASREQKKGNSSGVHRNTEK